MKKTRTFLSNKLWRDKIVTRLEQAENTTIIWRHLNDQEFDQQLRLKLQEESQEVATAQSRTELIEELADIYEVIDSLLAHHNITKNDVISAQIKKHEDRGGFSGRIYVETSEFPVGSALEKYCSALPDKYPEIK